MTTPFAPDLIFSRPGLGCSGCSNQAWKLGNQLGSFETSLEAYLAALEALQEASVASREASPALSGHE